jgi:hypothetical protein
MLSLTWTLVLNRYCVMFLEDRMVGKTQAIQGDVSPTWSQVIAISRQEIATHGKKMAEKFGKPGDEAFAWECQGSLEVIFKVYTESVAGDNDFLGEARVTLDELTKGSFFTHRKGDQAAQETSQQRYPHHSFKT